MLDEYQLVYITRGGGWFESRTVGRRRVETGHVICLFPGMWHRYTPVRSTGWDEYWLAFAGREANVWMAEHGFTPKHPLRFPGESRELVAVYEKILDELRTERHGGGLLMAAWVVEAIARIVAEETRRALAGEKIAEAVLQARARMLEQADQPLNVPALARELHVSYSWFRRKFRQYTGFSPAQYHLQLRLNRAKELLRTTSLPVAEIAERVGFKSLYYFSRCFHSKIGLSPIQYRARTQGQD